MLSILIPVYNYNITTLVHEIHKQAIEAQIKFEILCLEDGSNKFVSENKLGIEKLINTSIIKSNSNIGRIKSRQTLADNSNYDWLLFLDADVKPKTNHFIKYYIQEINSDYEAIYGGFSYEKKKPEDDSVLRWKYGKSCEEIDSKKRNLNPYQVIISANFLIKKVVFNTINSKIKKKSYGLDTYFGALLKQNHIKVLHINNEVYHLGIENSTVYLNKIKEFINTLLCLYNDKKLPKHSNKLLSIFIFCKKVKLNYVLSFFYKTFNEIIKKNLTESAPNLYLLQLYKISYICYKDLD